MELFLGSANAAELISFLFDIAALLCTIIYLVRVAIHATPSLFNREVFNVEANDNWSENFKRSLLKQHVGKKRFA